MARRTIKFRVKRCQGEEKLRKWQSNIKHVRGLICFFLSDETAARKRLSEGGTLQ
jgi:hypothetical protein